MITKDTEDDSTAAIGEWGMETIMAKIIGPKRRGGGGSFGAAILPFFSEVLKFVLVCKQN